MELFFLFSFICIVFGYDISRLADWTCPTGTYISDNECLPCQDNCSVCLNNETCYACKATYWGIIAECGVACPTTCLYSECDDYFGQCKLCPPKHYGRLCETRLEILCADGLYPVSTDQGNFECRNCSKDCLRCDENECFSCRPGFYKHLLEADCQRCTPNCNRCTDKVCIECKDGRFGHYCEHKCTLANCKKCSFGLSYDTIVCQECKPEFILHNGECYCPLTCTESCDPTGEECAGRCIDVSKNCKQCGKDNAEICLECNYGFYGNKCHLPCSRYCINIWNKYDSLCSMKDGTCNNCDFAYYGRHCNFICPSYCRYTFCDQNNATCEPKHSDYHHYYFGEDEGEEKDNSSTFYQIGLGVCALAVIAFIVCLVKGKYSSAIINQNITPNGVRGENMAISQQNDVTRPIDRQNDATSASNQQNGENEDSPYDYIDIDFLTNNSSDNSTYFSDGYLRPVGQRTRNVDSAYLTPVYRTEETGYDEIQYQVTDCQSEKRNTYLELSAGIEEETTL